MDIVCNSQLLASELRLLSKIAPSKPALPVLANVLIKADDRLRISATDLEVGLSTQCAATINAPGAITLPAKKFLDIIEQLPSADVQITLDKNHVRVTSGAFKSRLQAIPADDFPSLPDVTGEIVTLPSKALRGLIDKTRYAISDKASKFVLDGALLSLSDGVMAMVTTDSKRLALATASRAAGLVTTAIIPSKTLDVLTSFLGDGDVEFSQSDRHLFFQIGERVLFSRMLDGQFPKYDRIIPRDNSHVAVIGRTALTAAIKRVGLVSEQNQSASFSFTPGGLTVSTSSAEIGDADEALLCEYQGPALKVTMNYTYVLDFLTAAQEQQVSIALKDDTSAVLLSDGTDTINVVMVMRS
jgi:DNA polymerase-3 subunit beta